MVCVDFDSCSRKQRQKVMVTMTLLLSTVQPTSDIQPVALFMYCIYTVGRNVCQCYFCGPHLEQLCNCVDCSVSRVDLRLIGVRITFLRATAVPAGTAESAKRSGDGLWLGR